MAIPPFFRLARHRWGAIHGRASLNCSRPYHHWRPAAFDPREASIGLETADHDGLHHLSLNSIRTIQLSTPLALIRDAGLISGAGTDAIQVATKRAFVVRFGDGKIRPNYSRFVREKIGLFYTYFKARRLAPCAASCRRNSWRCTDRSVVGDTLVRSGQLSDAELATAWTTKESARGKAGQHLMARGIVSPKNSSWRCNRNKTACGEARRAAVGGGSDLR